MWCLLLFKSHTCAHTSMHTVCTHAHTYTYAHAHARTHARRNTCTLLPFHMWFISTINPCTAHIYLGGEEKIPEVLGRIKHSLAVALIWPFGTKSFLRCSFLRLRPKSISKIRPKMFVDFVNGTTQWIHAMPWLPGLAHTDGSSDDIQTGLRLLLNAHVTDSELTLCSYRLLIPTSHTTATANMSTKQAHRWCMYVACMPTNNPSGLDVFREPAGWCVAGQDPEVIACRGRMSLFDTIIDRVDLFSLCADQRGTKKYPLHLGGFVFGSVLNSRTSHSRTCGSSKVVAAVVFASFN